MHRRSVEIGVLVALVTGVLLAMPTGHLHQDAAHYSPPAAFHNVFGGAITPAAVRLGLVAAVLIGLIGYCVARLGEV